jgi:hypothetical protein
MEVKEELLIDRWFGSCLLGFGFSSVRLDGRKVRISRRSSEIKQTGCRFWKEGTILVHLLLLAGTEKRWELAHLSIKLLLLNIRGNPTFFTRKSTEGKGGVFLLSV